MKVGFIGLGKMGVPMASNLIDAGHELEAVTYFVSQHAIRLAIHPHGRRPQGADLAFDAAAVGGTLVAAEHEEKFFLSTEAQRDFDEDWKKNGHFDGSLVGNKFWLNYKFYSINAYINYELLEYRERACRDNSSLL